jgi:hypothetical protein
MRVIAIDLMIRIYNIEMSSYIIAGSADSIDTAYVHLW